VRLAALSPASRHTLLVEIGRLKQSYTLSLSSFHLHLFLFRTWQQFEADFRTFYYPLDYYDDLKAQISRRLQKQGESVSLYFTDLQTMIRRYGSITPEQELRWLYGIWMC